MTKMLGNGIWARRPKVGLWLGAGCAVPRRTRSAQRLREKRAWERDAFEEDAPDYPEWIDQRVAYIEARIQ